MDAGWFEQSNHPAFVFRFTKSIKDDFYVTVSLVRKSNRKRRFLRSFCFCKKNQKAAVRVATLTTPGERFKALHGYVYGKNYSFSWLKQHSGFEPVQKGNCTANTESVFAENRSCSACLPPQAIVKKEKCTLYWVRRKRKIGVGKWKVGSRAVVYLCAENRNFYVLAWNYPFSKITTFCSLKNAFPPNHPVPWNT